MVLTSLVKKSKKEQRRAHLAKRGSWCGTNPVTKIIPNKKAYRRNKKIETGD